MVNPQKEPIADMNAASCKSRRVGRNHQPRVREKELIPCGIEVYKPTNLRSVFQGSVFVSSIFKCDRLIGGDEPRAQDRT